MNRSDVAFVCGLGGLLLGAYAVFVSIGARSETNQRWTDIQGMVKSDDDHLAGMGAKLVALDNACKDLQRRVNGLDVNPRTDRLKALEERIDALEKSRGGAAPPQQGDAPKDGKSAMSADEFDALKKKMYAGQATPDEQAKFWAAIREKPELLADVMKQLEKAVADNPGDKEAHRNLAESYLLKLMSVPDGMEKGVWSSKMIGQDKAILDIDPNDWDARYSVGINYSFWPEQFNKRPDAIKEFETLLKVQDSQTPEPKFAQTYFQLRQLYLKDGRTDDANKMLDEGLRRFPDDAELQKAKNGAK